MKTAAWLSVLALVVSLGPISSAGDFNGDGTADIAVFRSASGLWAVRGVTRLYFGTSGDSPVPGDYFGTGTDQVTIYREASGLWAVRGLTRLYFGQTGDGARAGDYNGDGTEDMGLFRPGTGLWVARGVTRAYFGSSGDFAIKPEKVRGRRGGLLQTGQFTKYSDGDDGYYQAGIAFSYQTADPAGNGEIVTVDNVTGLMWASDGTGKGCDYGGMTTWSLAVGWAEDLDFAGHIDWRLPNRRELESLVDISGDNPALHIACFPNTPPSGHWWTGSTLAFNTTQAWYVDFQYGISGYTPKSGTCYVRAVRGGL